MLLFFIIFLKVPLARKPERERDMTSQGAQFRVSKQYEMGKKRQINERGRMKAEDLGGEWQGFGRHGVGGWMEMEEGVNRGEAKSM